MTRIAAAAASYAFPFRPIIERTIVEVKKQMKRGIQKLESKKQSEFLYVAEALGLGLADRGKIRVKGIKAA